MNNEIQKAIDELQSINEGSFNPKQFELLRRKISGRYSKRFDITKSEQFITIDVGDFDINIVSNTSNDMVFVEMDSDNTKKSKDYGMRDYDKIFKVIDNWIKKHVNESTIAVQNAIDGLSMINEKVDIDSPLSVTTFLTSQFKDSSRAKYEVEDVTSDKNEDSDYDVTVSWHIIKKGYAPAKGDIFIDLETGDWIDNYGSGKRFNNAKDLVSSIKKHIKSDIKSIHG